MRRFKLHSSLVLVLTVVGLLACGSVLAEKPDQAGGGKNKNHEQNSRHEGGHVSRTEPDKNAHEGRDGGRGNYAPSVTVHFNDQQRTAVRKYYSERMHSGHCPPGLAKKNNGCLPPGQAKKWAVGQALPRDVIFYDPSPEIVIRLGTPPPSHRFVRVANDILLIAVGTGMVMDAIADLGRL